MLHESDRMSLNRKVTPDKLVSSNYTLPKFLITILLRNPNIVGTDVSLNEKILEYTHTVCSNSFLKENGSTSEGPQ